ncbi:hypothetical protein [Pseudobacteriovorax antillogorgiicola]|uniref:Uncharacterized protein n=1 Tax=Pseudobacteriovorax antillogorgiicola TaxID=1513793 RepID=A0A1Y6C0G5_9BACT|nr:hypothetical protein [Pseudobacteriovorax antillogorgiicola]TCS51211.1 hypothetical protein EDD56_11195 [Pseudobacteriovorax antillogorgiicola]SMF37111.1 hypothetical protein SAMN06296036_11183 [Pseudobacteriovorax antillogorgiicola]
MHSYKVSKITAILNQSNTTMVIDKLQESGFSHIYLQDGRNPIMSRQHSLLSLVTGRRSLFSIPVKILNLYVQEKLEFDLLNMISTVGQLHFPGMGAVFSEPCHLFKSYDGYKPHGINILKTKSKVPLLNDLMGICCIVQRGEADQIARIILESGIGVPTVVYGTGTGLREKIGLLRVTIPAEKEVISLIVPKWDVSDVVETLIAVGRLHLPGRGFINTFPIHRGILNTKLSLGSKYQAASTDQIISAIDSLYGSVEWRRNEIEHSPAKKRSYLDGSDLNIICNSGKGVNLVRAAMKAGCSGATIEQMRMLQRDEEHNVVSPARERCKMMIKHTQVHTIIDAVSDAGAFDDNVQSVILSQDVPKAFTYLKKTS